MTDNVGTPKAKHRMTQGLFGDYEAAAAHSGSTVQANWEKLKQDPGIEIIPESERDPNGIGDLSVMFMYPHEIKALDIPGIGKMKFVLNCSPNLWEYIGDLSQDLLECSYNEDWIRLIWVEGRLDAEVAEKLKEYPWRLEHHKREDGRYSDQMTALVKMAGGWTEGWGPEVVPLTPTEQTIVDAFNYDIVVKE